jgi:hypothetical protein
MISPDLVSTDIWTEPPATHLWTIAVIPIVDEDLKSLRLFILPVHNFAMVG